MKGSVFMKIKNVLNMVVCGAATTLGGLAVTKVIQISNDPYEKARLKQKVRKIKNTFVAKIES